MSWRAVPGFADPLHSGTYAYAISNLYYATLTSTGVAAAPNTKYDLHAFIRGEINPDDSEGYWFLRATFYNSSGAMISYINAASGGAGSLNTSWKYVGGQVTAPANTATVKVNLISYTNSGWVTFDDVTLTGATPAKPST